MGELNAGHGVGAGHWREADRGGINPYSDSLSERMFCRHDGHDFRYMSAVLQDFGNILCIRMMIGVRPLPHCIFCIDMGGSRASIVGVQNDGGICLLIDRMNVGGETYGLGQTGFLPPGEVLSKQTTRDL